MVSNYREAQREGTAAAARLHVKLGSRQRIETEGSFIDVFAAILDLKSELMFRPLDGLLGAFLPQPFLPGILITTKRPLAIQRFTAAHELGHFLLQHSPSLDGDEMLRRSVQTMGRKSHDLQEVAADAFAVTFMMPRWLIEWHCDRHEWRGEELRYAENVYQLALRLGSSYQASCWTLLRYKLISPQVCKHLLQTSLRELKMDLLGHHTPNSYHGNVWLITEADAGTRICGSSNDLFVVRLEEHTGGGYLWNFNEFEKSGFAILDDIREALDTHTVGGNVSRRVLASAEAAEHGHVSITETRPWIPHVPRSQFVLDYDVTGPEREGLSRVERRRLLEAA